MIEIWRLKSFRAVNCKINAVNSESLSNLGFTCDNKSGQWHKLFRPGGSSAVANHGCSSTKDIDKKMGGGQIKSYVFLSHSKNNLEMKKDNPIVTNE